jgi:type I restriction enzyme, S subunit
MTVASACKKVSVGIVIQPAQYYTKEDFGIRAFRSTNVGEGRVNNRDWVYISKDGHKKNIKSELKIGDVLVIRSGAPGTSCVVFEEYAGSNCIDLVFARPKKDIILPEYLCLFTNSDIGKKQIKATQGGLALKHFNVGAYKKLMINVPDLSDQFAITNLLCTWDQIIEKTERLIEAKERRFLRLSNCYLFGGNLLNTKSSKRTRWFSAPEHWKIVSIGSMSKEINITNNSGESMPVLSCTKYDGLVDSLTYFDKQVFSMDTSNYKVVSKGQFAYATNHIEEGSIGYQSIYSKGLVSPMYTVFKANPSIDDGYLYKVLKTSTYKHIFKVHTSASVDRRGSLRWKEFAKLPVPLPPADEQRKISGDLDVVRTEIDLLKNLLQAYRKQKRGLMQKLLTGQWRVKTLTKTL